VVSSWDLKSHRGTIHHTAVDVVLAELNFYANLIEAIHEESKSICAAGKGKGEVDRRGVEDGGGAAEDGGGRRRWRREGQGRITGNGAAAR